MKLLVIIETPDGRIHVATARNPEAVRSELAQRCGAAWIIYASGVPARLDCRVIARQLSPLAASGDRVAVVRSAWELCFGDLSDWRTKARRRAETGIEIDIHPADGLIDHLGGHAPRVWCPCVPAAAARQLYCTMH